MITIWGLAIFYYVVIIVLGVRANRLVKTSSDFLVGGRNVSWILQGVGFSAMVVAGTTLATQGSIGYTTGLAGHWWVTTWCLAVTLGSFIFATYFRKTGGLTQTEWLSAYFQDEKVKLVASIALAMGCFFSPLANILGGSMIISGLMGIQVNYSILIMGAAVTIYLFFGGLWAALITDFAQWVLAALFFVIAAPLFMITHSDPGMWSSLPSSYWSIGTGGNLAIGGLALPSIIGMFWTNFCLVSGGFYWNKSASLRNSKDSKKAWLFGVLISTPYIVIVPFIGMFIKAKGIDLEIPDQALGSFFGMMPSALAAFGLIAVLAATMSTAVSGIMAGSTVLVRDILGVSSDNQQNSLIKSRVTTLAFALASVFGAMIFNKVIPVLGSAFALALLSGFVASIIPSLLGVMFWKGSRKEGVVVSIAAATVAIVIIIGFTDFWRVFHPQYFGFLLSAVLFVIVSLIAQKTGPWWGRSVQDELKESRSDEK